jgi:hypothetical protein
MAMVLTQTYLEASQKKALGLRSKKTGRNVSELMRDAVDALLLGVSADELKQLDAATQRAQIDIVGMKNALDQNALEHTAFLTEMTRLRGLHA